MSHTVKIKTQFKEFGMLKEAFKKLGWTIREKSKIRTYSSDPARNTVYDHIAVNPRDGYDIGLVKNDNGTFDLACDHFDSSIGAQLGGRDFTKLKQNYSLAVLEDEFENQGWNVTSKINNQGEIDVELEKFE